MRITTAATRKILGFDDTWFMIIGIVLIAFLIPLIFFDGTPVGDFLHFGFKFGIAGVYTIVYWVSMRSIFIFLRRRYPGYAETRRRVGYTILLGVAVYFVASQLLDVLIHDVFLGRMEEQPPQYVMNIVSLTIILAVGALYESVFLYNRWKEAIIEREKLERIHFQSQLEGLRNQVNPHFLFNSLNTLSYIIPEDAEKAVKFVQQLSKVYRYILEIRDKKLISLSEELNFLQSYLFLLKERFGENLQVAIDVPTHLHNDHIVPFLYSSCLRMPSSTTSFPRLNRCW